MDGGGGHAAAAAAAGVVVVVVAGAGVVGLARVARRVGASVPVVYYDDHPRRCPRRQLRRQLQLLRRDAEMAGCESGRFLGRYSAMACS